MVEKPKVYLDSSVLVSLALRDPNRFDKILSLTEGAELFTSELSKVEATAGIVSHLHGSDPLRLAVENLMRILETFQRLRLSTRVLEEARNLVLRHRVTMGLQSVDALHIASWNLFCNSLSDRERSYASFLTADRKQYAAWSAEGRFGVLIS